MLHGKNGTNVILTTIGKLRSWIIKSSLWPMHIELACCSVEVNAAMACNDIHTLGVGMFQGSPQHSDVMIVAGTVTLKMAEELVRMYEKMAEPKFVISMGNCSISGGPYWQHGYHVLKGIDQILPVDIYIPGCPPRPEALIEGIRALQAKIDRDFRTMNR